MSKPVELERAYGARNYAPLPATLARAEGAYVWDESGKRYLDLMGAYSAVSFGHRHPRLVAALKAQLDRLDTVSRAFFTDRLGPFLKRACEMTGMDAALPMNTGAEAVETALKAARKWAYKVKKVPEGRAEIIACDGNFHGRTIAITGLSSVAQYRDGFGPFPAGLKRVPFGDAKALEAAITPFTAAFLVEPIQGEGGVNVPPAGYLADCARICREHNVLLIADEVQTGLGRTGKLLAIEHEGIRPDGLTLGKALGGGLIPVSMFLAKREVMDVFTPGDHGSTFGGNPLAAAVGLEVLDLLAEGEMVARSAELGARFLVRLGQIHSPLIREVRGRGLFAGIELHRDRALAPKVCERLLSYGVLSKDAGCNTLRFAPPFVVTREELDWAVEQIEACLAEVAKEPRIQAAE
jgi:ornithine--oxo-acid transaminase